ncbi:hypothetical protein [Methanoculleus oceani]|uniref:Abortive infection protein n=1 Tax=Methanoculleus oceani TaxID=2184756 RepID=A0ABD4TG52_9EURY|nr:hypothetical protein [Methanoculleus sp. CWC-02]MCM2466853.1 hypothetical protein [Methanoculleus sp. CWC-02]
MASVETAPGSTGLSRGKAFGIAVALYLVWVFATWLLEGRILLLQNPDPTGRLIYAVVANIVIGTLITLVAIRAFLSAGILSPDRTGFRPVPYAVGAVLLAGIVGALIYALSGFPTSDPVVFLNGFAQVFPTSVAEVFVCWTAIGMVSESLAQPAGKYLALVTGIVTATVFFGVYHIAHSPPFNTPMMIVFLMLPGLATSIFYFAVREVYSTIVFQNLMGTLGVLQNIDPAALARPNPGAITLALALVAVLIAADYLLVRKRFGSPKQE